MHVLDIVSYSSTQLLIKRMHFLLHLDHEIYSTHIYLSVDMQNTSISQAIHGQLLNTTTSYIYIQLPAVLKDTIFTPCTDKD